jgi:hypothetical protein
VAISRTAHPDLQSAPILSKQNKVKVARTSLAEDQRTPIFIGMRSVLRLIRLSWPNGLRRLVEFEIGLAGVGGRGLGVACARLALNHSTVIDSIISPPRVLCISHHHQHSPIALSSPSVNFAEIERHFFRGIANIVLLLPFLKIVGIKLT